MKKDPDVDIRQLAEIEFFKPNPNSTFGRIALHAFIAQRSQ